VSALENDNSHCLYKFVITRTYTPTLRRAGGSADESRGPAPLLPFFSFHHTHCYLSEVTLTHAHSPTDSHTHSLLTPSLTHYSPTHSLTHSLTYSLTH
jgi:hypothetical protein